MEAVTVHPAALDNAYRKNLNMFPNLTEAQTRAIVTAYMGFSPISTQLEAEVNHAYLDFFFQQQFGLKRTPVSFTQIYQQTLNETKDALGPYEIILDPFIGGAYVTGEALGNKAVEAIDSFLFTHGNKHALFAANGLLSWSNRFGQTPFMRQLMDLAGTDTATLEYDRKEMAKRAQHTLTVRAGKVWVAHSYADGKDYLRVSPMDDLDQRAQIERMLENRIKWVGGSAAFDFIDLEGRFAELYKDKKFIKLIKGFVTIKDRPMAAAFKFRRKARENNRQFDLRYVVEPAN